MQEFPTRFYIGVQKAGSSYLYNLLSSHTEICLSEGTEVNFFTRYFENGTDWYRERFKNSGAKVDISPTYFNDGSVAAERMRDFYSEPEKLRFVLFLRNPVDHLVSHFRMHKLHGYFKKHSDQYPNAPDDFTSFLKQNSFYADRSKYYKLFRPWLQHFDRSQFHVVLFEDFIHDTDAVMKKILAFWDIPHQTLSASVVGMNRTLRAPFLHKAKSLVVNHPKVKQTLKESKVFGWVYEHFLTQRTGALLTAKERKTIADYVRSDVSKLPELGVDVSAWKDFK